MYDTVLGNKLFAIGFFFLFFWSSSHTEFRCKYCSLFFRSLSGSLSFSFFHIPVELCPLKSVKRLFYALWPCHLWNSGWSTYFYVNFVNSSPIPRIQVAKMPKVKMKNININFVTFNKMKKLKFDPDKYTDNLSNWQPKLNESL